MPDPLPVPPAPNPTPTPSIRGYVNVWEFVQIVFGAIAAGGISYETLIPMLQSLAEKSDVWLVDPQHREIAKVVLGAAIAILSGVMLAKTYFRKGVPVVVDTVASVRTDEAN